jgi:hypothetical protein
MVKGIYVVRDNLAQCALGGPMIFAHDAVAVRFFGDLIKDERSAIAKYPRDHALLRIGTFDEETSIIVPQETISVIITGEAWLAVNQPEAPTS